MRRSVSMMISAAVCSKIPPSRLSLGPLLSARPVLYNPWGGLGMARGATEAGDRGESPTGSLNCADVKELFPDFLTGRLSPFQSVLFEEHRAACASCRSELAAGARDTLQGHLAWIPAPRQSVTAGIAARLRRRLFYPAHVKLPLEAAGLVIVAGLAFYVFQHSSPKVAVEKRSAAAPEPQRIVL